MVKENKLTKKEREEIVNEAKGKVWSTFWNTIGIAFFIFCVGFTFFSYLGFIDLNKDKKEMFCNDFKIISSNIESEFRKKAMSEDHYWFSYGKNTQVGNLYHEYCINTFIGKYS